MYVCMYVCMYVYMYLCMYVCMHVFVPLTTLIYSDHRILLLTLILSRKMLRKLDDIMITSIHMYNL